eukprot:TRINITY_DN6053_c0_g1_i1.p1 TRINITY_DN6053_c0_g1~~TRINITY_DN6053_c0_g1_i1.p1  ORF type:complete len:708 (-),score=171.64 TRINITY_DN6053_c0_g1_i1:63-2186(-)
MGNDCSCNNEVDSDHESAKIPTSEKLLETYQDADTSALEPLRGTLILTILRGQKLINVDGIGQGKSDPYVKIEATSSEKGPLLSLQTSTIENNLDPIWNERFSIYTEGFKSVTLKLSVWDEDKFDAHDPMGQVEIPIRSNFPFDQDLNIKLKPLKDEPVKGVLSVSVSYRPGEQLNLNQVHEERAVQKKNWDELPNEMKQNVKEWRACKDVLTEGEELKMSLMTRIYSSNFNTTSPVFALESHSVAMSLFEYKKSSWKVDSDNLTAVKYLKQLGEQKGDFVNEAKDIVEILCEFQSSKLDSYRSGYMNDPEGLWCEEFKEWAVKELALISCDSNAINFIDKRIGYLEECLLVSDLFDRPSSLAKATIQQAIIKVRSILKYRAIANIEKELSHEDANRNFMDLRREITGLIRSSFKFLRYVFRCETKGLSNADKFLLVLEMDQNLKQVLGDEIREVKEAIRNSSAKAESDLGTDAPWGKIDLREMGLKNTVDLLDPVRLDPKSPFLPLVFAETNCGVEQFFRKNAFIAFKFLRAHGLLIELGRLFVVLEKASNLAKTGGTLLVFGLGNAHLNAALNATEKILDEMKKGFNDVSKIAECCFEQLVFENQATSDRTLWIKEFKNVFPLINEVNARVKDAKKVVSEIKIVANSMSLSERFQKAAEEQNDFIATSEQFSKRVCEISGTPYTPPKPKPITPEESDAFRKLIQK